MVKAAWERHRIADTSERSPYRDSPVRRAGHQLQHQCPVMERTGLGGPQMSTGCRWALCSPLFGIKLCKRQFPFTYGTGFELNLVFAFLVTLHTNCQRCN